MKDYNHKEIEQKWQEKWNNENQYETKDLVSGRENLYVLAEFPYPSGNLHVGHWYAFGVTDIYARYMSMRGKNVMYPIGFDAFGLPAENAAIKHNLNPRTWTEENMENMRGQLRSMGAMFDWSREVVTCHSDYYKWTQFLFLELHKAGLVEKRKTTVNWDPVDKTVLANEQILPDGTAERSGALIEQKEMSQWTIGITKYADRLIDDLDELDWPQAIKDSQKNWIGRSKGAELSFEVENSEEKIDVFTTRPDTLFGVTYMVLAPEHALVKKFIESQLVENTEEVEKYIEKTNRKTERDRLIGEKEKTGVQLEGVFAINPANQEKVPVFIADYVLAGYGTGAVMAVPAHDERDNEFAKKYNLPITIVVEPETGVEKENEEYRRSVLVLVEDKESGKILTLNWGKDCGGNLLIGGGLEEGEDMIECAIREVQEETGYTDITFVAQSENIHHHYYAASKKVNRKIEATGLYFVLHSHEQVATTLEEDEQGQFEVEWMDKQALRTKICDGMHSYVLEKFLFGAIHGGQGYLTNSGTFNGLTTEEAKEKITAHVGGKMTNTYKLRDWIVSRQRYWGCPIPFIHCDDCGAVPVPQEQLPVELPDVEDYLPNDDGQSPLAKVTDWVNTSCPACSKDAKRETDTLDTFIDSSWYFLRYCDAQNENKFASEEKLASWIPVNFYSGGAEHTTMHLLYSRFFHKALYDIGHVSSKEPYTVRLNRGLILGTDGNKMSKSKGNVIDPDKEVEQFGADVVRTYLAFLGPYNEPGNYPWDQNGIVGVRRFIERCADLTSHIKEESTQELQQLLHQSIKKATDDYKRLKFNTVVAQLMTLMNMISKEGIAKQDALRFVQLLSPLAPHLSEELWQELGGENSIHQTSWPEFDETLLVSDVMSLAVQINGKVRAELTVESDASEEEIKQQATELDDVKKWLEDKEIKKIIYVKNKLVSIVIV